MTAPEFRAEVLVVGAGAAGVTAALHLTSRGKKVILVPGGGATETAADRDLYEGCAASGVWGHESLAKYRRRGLGGTTVAWGGRCVPFDPIDFEYRSWIPDSGWPISFAEYQRWWLSASEILAIGNPDFVVDSGPLLYEERRDDVDVPEAFTDDRIERWSSPVNFADILQTIPRELIRVVAGSATELHFDAAVQQVTGVTVTTIDGHQEILHADTVVLAAGAIENARLMMHDERLAARLPALGRYYMSHLFLPAIPIAAPRGVRPATGFFRDARVYCRRRWTFRPEHQRARQVGNLVAYVLRAEADSLDTHQAPETAIGSAIRRIRSAMRVEAGAYGKARALLASRGVLTRAVVSIATAGPAFWLSLAKFAVYRRQTPRIPMLLPPAKTPVQYLVGQGEHAPHESSRIELCDCVDRLGMRRVKVNVEFDRVDFELAEAFAESVEAYFGDRGLAVRTQSARYAKQFAQRMYGSFNSNAHQLGTTRMGLDPASSVVDPDCRVHGIENLFVAGGSVFPTSGHANPTFTIVCLSIRLADHVAGMQPREGGVRTSGRDGRGARGRG